MINPRQTAKQCLAATVFFVLTLVFIGIGQGIPAMFTGTASIVITAQILREML